MTKNVLTEKEELNILFQHYILVAKYFNWILPLSTMDSLLIWIIQILDGKYYSLVSTLST